MALTTVRPQGMGFNTGRRNLIINGAMQVAQRGTSSTTLTTYATVDRFLNALSGTTDQLAGTQAQSTTAPDGFSNSYKIDCTTAETSVDSSEFWRVRHYVEAQNLQHLKYGTSAAQSVTLSFYVRSNVTGTYACNIYQPDGVRQITKTYAISAADTWEYKTITFPGDTSGTINNDNGSGLEISWFLMAASNLTGTDSTSWGAYADGGLANGHAVNMASSTSNEWYITGVQLEVGENASDFEHRSYGEELALCQRYYYRHADGADFATAAVGLSGHYNSTILNIVVEFPVTMRTNPSLSCSNSAGAFRNYRNNSNDTFDTFTHLYSQQPNAAAIETNSGVSGTAGHVGRVEVVGSSVFVAFDAEL